MIKKIGDFDLVLFGGTGDLVMRKLLPALYHQHQDGNLPAAGRILCLGKREAPKKASKKSAVALFLARAQTLVKDYLGAAYQEAHWAGFAARIEYLQLDAREAAEYAELTANLAQHPGRVRVFYLATAPDLFVPICRNLAAHGLNLGQTRVVLEKPLGRDLASAEQIIAEVGTYFEENQIYRIDHYLGKEPVQNLLALRFGNALLEPLWRREWIRDVQITVTEEVGVEQRADFYDRAGTLRDMVQNHLLQLLSIVAMEPPSSTDADAIRDEKLKVLRSLRPMAPEDVYTKVVRGQYRAGASAGQPVPGYRDEPGVPPDSRTETFVALKAEICNWRWAGVPFFLRTGKRMQERLAEIVINFHEVPHSIFGPHALKPNQLVIRLQPNESVRLYMMAKEPGDQMTLAPVYLDLDFHQSFKTRAPEPYERLLKDVIRGDLSLFVRADELRTAWTWVAPILTAWENSTQEPKPYTAGTWGPAASSRLLSRDGLCWHEEE